MIRVRPVSVQVDVDVADVLAGLSTQDYAELIAEHAEDYLTEMLAPIKAALLCGDVADALFEIDRIERPKLRGVKYRKEEQTGAMQ